MEDPEVQCLDSATILYQSQGSAIQSPPRIKAAVLSTTSILGGTYFLTIKTSGNTYPYANITMPHRVESGVRGDQGSTRVISPPFLFAQKFTKPFKRLPKLVSTLPIRPTSPK